jgi:hypothetical protein
VRPPCGGDVAEGEDIEVIELLLEDALQMIAAGTIQDGKTIMLLQHAAIVGLDKLRDAEPGKGLPHRDVREDFQ